MSEEEKQAQAERKRTQQLELMSKLQQSGQSGSEQNSAAETLLELSNTGMKNNVSFCFEQPTNLKTSSMTS